MPICMREGPGDPLTLCCIEAALGRQSQGPLHPPQRPQEPRRTHDDGVTRRVSLPTGIMATAIFFLLCTPWSRSWPDLLYSTRAMQFSLVPPFRKGGQGGFCQRGAWS
jgi:hypothetical protein